jgi:hypothetical protein
VAYLIISLALVKLLIEMFKCEARSMKQTENLGPTDLVTSFRLRASKF